MNSFALLDTWHRNTELLATSDNQRKTLFSESSCWLLHKTVQIFPFQSMPSFSFTLDFYLSPPLPQHLLFLLQLFPSLFIFLFSYKNQQDSSCEPQCSKGNEKKLKWMLDDNRNGTPWAHPEYSCCILVLLYYIVNSPALVSSWAEMHTTISQQEDVIAYSVTASTFWTLVITEKLHRQ